MSTQESESDEHSTVNNDNLSVAVTKKPHCQIKFEIKVNPKAVEAAYQRACRNVSKEVTIPGFRKGKAPDAFIHEKFQSTIQREWIDIVLQTSFNEALHLTHLHPLNKELVRHPILKECSRDKGAHFTIEFEARPIIPSIKFDELKINKKSPTPVTDQDRQNVLQNLLLRFTTYEKVEGRAVQPDDFINVSVEMLEDPPRMAVKNQRTQVNQTGLPHWLRKKVIGLQAGESAEGMTEQDPNLIEPDPDFKPYPFRVTVHSIWQGTLPALDEELVKRVGLNSLDELHKKIDDQLELEAEEIAYQSNVQALEQLLVAKFPVEIPQSYIDSNKEARLNDYLEDLQSRKKEYSEEDHEQIEKMIEKSTIFHLQLFFLLSKIASDHNITVNQQELAQELSHQIALIAIQRNSVDLQDREKLQEQLYHAALDRKIKQFLIEHATSDE